MNINNANTSGDSLDKAQKVIIERINLLNCTQGTNPIACASIGLYSLKFVVFKLAARNLHVIDWKINQFTDRTSQQLAMVWYLDFINNQIQYCKAIQSAFVDGTLAIHDESTAFLLSRSNPEMDEWALLDIDHARKAVQAALPTLAATLNPYARDWPDEMGIPPGAIRLTELKAWAVPTGVATATELDSMFGECAEQTQPEPLATEARESASIKSNQGAPAQEPATPAPVATVVSNEVIEAAIPQEPVQRRHAQDAAILGEIRKQGYDPLALPKNPPGKKGVKHGIRSAIDGKGLFKGGTIFKRAWERLTANSEIVIKS